MLPSEQEMISLVADAAFVVTCSHSKARPAKGPNAGEAKQVDDTPSVFDDTTPAALSWRTVVPCQPSPGDHRRLW